MFSTKVRLCELQCGFPDANLKLESLCSLKLSSSQKLDNVSSDPEAVFESFQQAAAWVTRGKGLQLRVNLALDPTCVSKPEKQALAEHLGMLLRDAEVHTATS